MMSSASPVRTGNRIDREESGDNNVVAYVARLASLRSDPVLEQGTLVSVSGFVQDTHLNGCKGVVVRQACGGTAIRLNLFVYHGNITKATKVYIDDSRVTVIPIAKDWLETTRTSRFDQLAMMRCFRAPGRPYAPPALANFTNRNQPPSTELVEAFWGSTVFDFMHKALLKKLERGGRLRLLWYFYGTSKCCCGVVFGDGCQQAGQLSELSHRPRGEMFWPALFVQVDDGILVWCQAQALNGAQPWWAHPSRVVKLKTATLRISGGAFRECESPEFAWTPGPTFEDIDSDDGEWTLVS
jgi:hypothetical protein